MFKDRFNDLEKLKAEEARLGKYLKENDEEQMEEEQDLFSSSGIILDN